MQLTYRGTHLPRAVLCFLGDGVPKGSSANDNGTTIMYIPVSATDIQRDTLTTGCSGSGVNWIGHFTASRTSSGSFWKFLFVLCEQMKCFITGYSHSYITWWTSIYKKVIYKLPSKKETRWYIDQEDGIAFDSVEILSTRCFWGWCGCWEEDIHQNGAGHQPGSCLGSRSLAETLLLSCGYEGQE